MNQKYVFFSYCHKDQSIINSFAQKLRTEGYIIIFDEEMSAGDDWIIRAKRFIRSDDCECVIFFISDNSIISKPVLTELEYVKRYNKKYFAVMLDDDDVQTKFKKINKDPNISDDLVDVADQMQDYFPLTKLFVKNDSKAISEIIDSFKEMNIQRYNNEKSWGRFNYYRFGKETWGQPLLYDTPIQKDYRNYHCELQTGFEAFLGKTSSRDDRAEHDRDCP